MIRSGSDFCLLLMMLLFVFSADAFSKNESAPLILEHADQLQTSGSSGEVVNLIGHVHFIHEKADLYSQRATWYRTPGLVQFVDSVIVKDNSRQISARMMTYYRQERRLTAKDSVIVRDSVQNVILYAQGVDYFRDDKRVEAGGHPHLVFNPDIDTSRMDITALKMVYFSDQAHGSAYDSVTIIRSNLLATGGQAEFFKNPERAILTKSPEITENGNHLTGDTISIFTEDRKLRRLQVEGDAKADYSFQPDTSLAEFSTATLTGKELEAFFANDQIERIVTRHNAVSIYSPAVTDTLIRGANTASGDSITLFFTEGNIRRVLIAGGAQGEFIEPKLAAEGKIGADTTRYSGGVIDYNVGEAQITLTDNGELHYQDMALNAGDIKYETNSKILSAQGVKSDTSQVATQMPLLKQGTEELKGERMTYNLVTKKGQIRMARTSYEGGYYSGEKVRQSSQDVLLVSSGNYSSCDREPPHYHFHSNQMKLITKDKIIAKPVIFYIGDIPVFAIPYYVFPIRKGRHSGFLPFEIGNFERGQRFVRNVGYYWAGSDYMDLESSFDFYESARTIFNNNINYNLRYRLNGSAKVNYSRETSWDAGYRQHLANRWRFQFSHDQTITPSMKLAGSGTFMSDKNFISDNIFDPNQRLDRSIHSNLHLTKSWKYSAIVVNADQTWNLDTDFKRELLPSISYSHPAFAVFPVRNSRDKKTREKPGENFEEPKKRFYNTILFSLGSASAQNLRQRTRNADSTFSYKNFQTAFFQGGLSAPQNIMGYVTITPATSISETMFRLDSNALIDSLGDSLNLKDSRIITRETYNYSISANTKLYGVANPNFLGLTGLRHVMTPRLTYTFTPTINKNKQYIAYTGVGVSSSKARTMNFALGNLFQAKYKSGDKENKLDLFSVDMSSSYNFIEPVKKIGNLATSVRTISIPNVDFTLNMNHSFYNDSRIVVMGVSNPGGLPSDTAFARTTLPVSRRPLLRPRLVTMTFRTSIHGGYHPSEKEEKAKPEAPQRTQRRYGRGSGYAGSTSSQLGIDFTVTHDYSISKGITTLKTQKIDLGTQLQPTRNWHFTFGCYYDIIKKQLESASLGITRDLHCWEASFTWTPSGTGGVTGYYIRINIKSIPDIKLEKSEGNIGRSIL